MNERQPQPRGSEQSGVRKRSSKELFALDKTTHPLLEKYPAAYLARGAEHFVYEIEKADKSETRDIVVKAHVASAKLLHEYEEDHGNGPELPADTRATFERLIDADREKFEKFRTYFGSKHVLAQRKFLMNVPISEGISREIFPHEDTPVETTWTLVTVQQRAKELGEEYLGHHFDLRSRDRGTQRLLELSSRDEGLRESLADFVAKAIRYTNEEGEILDLVGANNVVFAYRQAEDGTRIWNYRIVDGFSVRPKTSRIKQAGLALAGYADTGKIGQPAAAHDASLSLEYAGTMNTLAEALGLPDRVTAFEEVSPEDAARFEKEVQHSNRYTASEKVA